MKSNESMLIQSFEVLHSSLITLQDDNNIIFDIEYPAFEGYSVDKFRQFAESLKYVSDFENVESAQWFITEDDGKYTLRVLTSENYIETTREPQSTFDTFKAAYMALRISEVVYPLAIAMYADKYQAIEDLIRLIAILSTGDFKCL